MYFILETHSFFFFATLRHFARYPQFSDALYGVYTNVFRQVQKLYIESHTDTYPAGGQLGRMAQLANALELASPLVR